jgi:hypothetical protein
MKKEKEEETYTLTLKGLLSLSITDKNVLQKTLDSLELYLRRHYSNGGHPAIVFDLNDNEFHFVTLGKKE